MDIIEFGHHGESFVPDACTLPTAQQPLRVAEFAELFASAVSAVTRESATRLRLALDGEPMTLGRARDLAARESECCSFFTFTFDAVGELERERQLSVEVPAAHTEVLDGLQALAETATRDRQPM